MDVAGSNPVFRSIFAGPADAGPVLFSEEVAVSREPRGPVRSALERVASSLLEALGLDRAADPELAESPARIADFYLEACSSLGAAEPRLETFPSRGGDDVVVVRDLEFHSLCVHHFAPFFGRALIAYAPGDRLLGVSGAARILDFHARRPQLQERMTAQIADHLERVLAPRGVAVVLEARHLCMEMRGVRRRAVLESRVVRGALAAPELAAVLRFDTPRDSGGPGPASGP